VANTPVIRTPDQRLRVFVSSTLDELANERRTVRDAVERLRLAAVMFELGARPHPPRELYRAYLEQSRTRLGEAEFEARRRSAADRELFETLTATIAADRSPRSA
jgi:hypothetical protein